MVLLWQMVVPSMSNRGNWPMGVSGKRARYKYDTSFALGILTPYYHFLTPSLLGKEPGSRSPLHHMGNSVVKLN